MGMYTKVEYKVKLKASEVENVTAFLQHIQDGPGYDHRGVFVWDDGLIDNERVSDLGREFRVDKNGYLQGRDEIKNYFRTLEEYYSFLLIVSDEIVTYRTKYEENDDWYDHVNCKWEADELR
jgi:hypothetical protein